MEKKKQKVEFQEFLDGLCSFWQLDENKKPKKVKGHIRFQERVVGIKRNYLAEQNGHTVERLIRIPRTDLNFRGTFAVIEGCQYSIQQAQNLHDTIPKCTQLTLVQPDILLDFNQEEAGACGRL